MQEGVEDAIYINYFGSDPEAAMLACDMYGVLPENLLYVPKEYFDEGDDSDQVVLVRYTLFERSRQGTFRQLLGAKRKLITEGRVKELWKERRLIHPDAPWYPTFLAAELEQAANTLDTESDEEDGGRIDERGMVKPPPPVRIELADAKKLSDSPSGAQKADGTAFYRLSSDPLTDDLPLEEKLSVASPFRLREEDLRMETARTGKVESSQITRKRQSGSPNLSRMTKRTSCPAAAPAKPRLPCVPMPLFPRSKSTLKRDEKELKLSRRRLNQYTTKTARKMETEESEEDSLEHEDILEVQSLMSDHNADEASSIASRQETAEVKLPRLPAGLKQFAAGERKYQEMEAMRRVAAAHVRNLQKRYRRGKEIDYEMEDVPELGTLEHKLQYQRSIGVCPTYEERVEMYEDQVQLRQEALLDEREAQWEREFELEEKQRRAEETLILARENQKGIIAEVQRTKRYIAKRQISAAERKHEWRLEKLLFDSAKKHAKAQEYLTEKAGNANQRRYEHDQEEVFRRRLHDKMREMEEGKSFDVRMISDFEL